MSKREGESIDQESKRVLLTDENKDLNAKQQLKVWISAKHIYQKDFDKFLKSLSITYSKSKKAPKTDYAIITFATEDDKNAAANVLQVAELKGKPLTVAEHVPVERSTSFQAKEMSTEDDGRSPQERIADQVTPLWKKSYSEQLEIKQDRFKKVLNALKSEIYKLIPKKKKKPAMKNENGVVTGVPSEENDECKRQQMSWIKDKVKDNDGLPCPLLDIIPSPVETGYRNKCEFTFGKDIEGNPTVGFLLGLYKEGYSSVISPENCLHVSETAKKIAKALENMVRESMLPVYDRVSHQGFWRLVQVRTFTSGENSILLQVNPSGISDSDLQKTKELYVRTVKEMSVDVHSCSFQIWDGVFNGFKDDFTSELLMGSNVIHENLCNVKFQVSPQAFFQVNTPATETLFSLIKDWVLKKDVLPENVVLLDLCCGTGTIGIALSSHFKRVIGVEMVQDAINDAKANADLNGIKNVEYLCGKIEDVMGELVNSISDTDSVVAILDPPRSGVHSSVIQSIRGCSKIDRLIYISCNAESAQKNFVDLSRPTSKRYEGNPFIPVRGVGVDLFPMTAHAEWVMEWERLTSQE